MIWRKIKNIGLQSSYTYYASYKKFIQNVISLASTPQRYLQVISRSFQAAAPQDNKAFAFSEYFKTMLSNGKYEIAEWTTYNKEGPKTNNQ